MKEPQSSSDPAILETQARLSELGMLVAGIAHELSNPLGFVKSNNEFLISLVAELLGQGVTPERIRSGLTEMAAVLAENSDGLQRMARITSELKRVARGDSSKTLCDIEAVLERALLLAHNALKYKAEVIREYGHPREVIADEGKLAQVFLNLLVNAAQAIEDRGEVRVITAEDDRWAVVTIADTGKGIAQEHLTQLFRPFFTTKPPGKGTGLGLWIAKRIIEDFGGEISAESTPGKGTRFVVRLPCGEHPQP